MTTSTRKAIEKARTWARTHRAGAEERRLRGEMTADGTARLELAALLAATGRPQDALDLLVAADPDAPSGSDLVLLRAIVCSSSGKLTQAREDLELLIAREPDNADLHVLQAETLFRLERLEEACCGFLEAARIEPQRVDAWTNAGMIRFRQNRYPEAQEFLARANRLAPDHPVVLKMTANTLRAMGRIEDALHIFGRLERSAPVDVATLDDHALCLLASGDGQAANMRYAQALKRSPSDQSALAGLYMCALSLGNTQFASRLMDYERLLGITDVDVDASLLASLTQAAVACAGLVWEPAGRSTVGGQQSAMLDLSEGSPFHPLQRIILDLVSQRMRGLAGSTDHHPWLAARPARWRPQAWVTVLHEGGMQAPHLHPAGWMSGVIYLDAGSSGADGGGLVFGHPPEEANLEAVTPIAHTILPRRGLAVLFPSYFLHHTMPYPGGASPRVSIAFDVIPL